MPLLKSIRQPGWSCEVEIDEEQGLDLPFTLGRSPELSIPAEETAISRKHVQVVRDSTGQLSLKPLRQVWLRKGKSRKLQAVQPGDNTELSTGDAFYLACKNGTPTYGFRVQELATPSAVSPQSPSSSPALQSPTKSRRTSSTPQSRLPNIFQGLSLVFWEHDHMRRAIELCKAAGAEVCNAITPDTTHVVAAEYMTASEAAQRLGQEAGRLKWPAVVQFVAPTFVTHSLAKQRLQDAAEYVIDVYKSTYGKVSDTQESGSQSHAEDRPTKILTKTETPGCEKADAEGFCSQQPPALNVQAEQGQNSQASRVTGGNSGVAWGQGSVWIEPWDEKSALETVSKLDRWWHKREYDGSRELTADGVAADLEIQPDGKDRDTLDEVGVSTSGCAHKCCAACSTCIVEEMKALIANYDRGGTDQFRRRAAENGIRKIMTHPKTLRTQEDVRALDLGKETTAKVAEIVETGTLARNRALEVDPIAKVVLKFAKVWGTGHSTASKWHASGCRTLEDVSRRTDLTEQQRAGVKHFDDMQLKNSRTEGARIAEIVTSAALALFGWDLNSNDAPHIRAMGSFLRGKKASSDLDMLILPPMSEQKTPSEILDELWHHLYSKEFLTADIQPHRVKQGDASSTFLGFCHLPGEPRVRRIDIKVYPRRSLPFAVNYFTGSGAFNRALRYWAYTSPVTQQAAQNMAAGSTGFKLNDTDLTPISRSGARDSRQEVPTGLPVQGILCESDIFEALSLAYVPPHLRMTNE